MKRKVKMTHKKKAGRPLNKQKVISLILIPILILTALFSGGVGVYYNVHQNQANTELNNSNNIIAEEVIDEEQPSLETLVENVLTEETAEEAEPEEEKAEPREHTTVYTTTGVNMRNAPSLDGEIVKTYVINSQLDKVGEVDGWTIIEVDGTDYYIKSDYISTKKTEIKVTSRSSNTSRETKSTAGTTSTQQAAAAQTDTTKGTFLGYYTLTYYCSCSKCCGSYANGITASGTTAVAGRTVAVPTNIKLGTKLNIGGHVYVAEDRGGAIKGNKIDVYVNSHSEALAKGVTKNVPVYIAE